MLPDFVYSGIPIKTSADTPDRPLTSRRLPAVLWLALVSLALVLSLRQFDAFQLGAYRDDSLYVLLAQSLVSSDAYGLINGPGAAGRVAFPFGFPLLLAPLAALFPDRPTLLRLVPLAATLVNAGLLFWGWRWFSRRSQWWGLAVSALYLLAPFVLEHSRQVMSEPVFLMFSLLGFMLTEQMARRQEKRGHAFWLGAVLAFIPFTRTVGVVFVGAILAYLLYRRGLDIWPQLALAAGTAAAVVALVVAVTPVRAADLLPLDYFHRSDAAVITAGAALPDPTPAVASKSRLARLVQDYLIDGGQQHLGEDLRDAVLPFGGGSREQALGLRLGLPNLPHLIGYLTFILLVLGWGRWLRQEGLSVFNFAGILYFGAMFLWVWEGPRLLYPIQPQLEFGMLLGIEAVLAGLGALLPLTLRRRQVAITAVVILLAGISLVKNLSASNSRDHTGDLRERTTWITAHTPPNAVIMTELPEVDYLYSGRKTVAYPFWDQALSADGLAAYLAQSGADYVLVVPEMVWLDEFTPTISDEMEPILPLLDELAARGRIIPEYVDETGFLTVYRVNRQKAGQP
ncbi:MAG: hypothetical protein D6784_09590 [Chloroflexi bacterium]|nr:MAG: hypothetical protein D6784_09590 [Chloroflexota bacterium]